MASAASTQNAAPPKETSTTPSSTTESPLNPTNSLIYLCYLSIFLLWLFAQIIEIPYVLNLLFLVSSILYVGCHRSLILLDETPSSDSDDDEPRTTSERETMKKEDAMQFPLLGSASLFTLYLAFKFFDRDVVNFIISCYFAMMGSLALTVTTSPLLASLLNSKRRFSKEILIPHPLPSFLGGESPWDLSIDATLAEILSFVGSVVFSFFYFKSKHWAMNNVIGICFCLQGIERFSLGTYKIGAILLVGLFFYDIFWVFGTDVMVTVAKNIDGPIKILFPRSLTPNPETQKIELSLLGLGDIVIPGFFLGLLLRFDAHRASTTQIHAKFPKPYFHFSLIAYILGLALTLFVMIKFDSAQPALLYLVPACLGSSLICAWKRGEINELLEYSEEVEEDEAAEEDGKEDGKEEPEKDEDTKKQD